MSETWDEYKKRRNLPPDPFTEPDRYAEWLEKKKDQQREQGLENLRDVPKEKRSEVLISLCSQAQEDPGTVVKAMYYLLGRIFVKHGMASPEDFLPAGLVEVSTLMLLLETLGGASQAAGRTEEQTLMLNMPFLRHYLETGEVQGEEIAEKIEEVCEEDWA